MSVNLKSLIGRLNDTTRVALDGAAGLCLSLTHYDIEIEKDKLGPRLKREVLELKRAG